MGLMWIFHPLEIQLVLFLDFFRFSKFKWKSFLKSLYYHPLQLDSSDIWDHIYLQYTMSKESYFKSSRLSRILVQLNALVQLGASRSPKFQQKGKYVTYCMLPLLFPPFSASSLFLNKVMLFTSHKYIAICSAQKCEWFFPTKGWFLWGNRALL